MDFGLSSGALVHTGEAGYHGVDASGLTVQGGQEFAVVGIELFQKGEVVGVHLVFQSTNSA